MELAVIEAIRAVRVGAGVGRGDLVVVGNEDGAGDAPILARGGLAHQRLALGVVLEVRGQPLGQQEIRRKGMEIALSHRDRTRRERCQHGADDFGIGLLIWLGQIADAKVQRLRVARRDLPAVVRQVDVAGRLARPDRQDRVDRLEEHLVAVLIQDAERLRIRRQCARADAEDEAPARKRVEHRGLRRDQHRMGLRQVRRAARKLDRPRVRDQRGQEQHAVGDALAMVGQVLADEGVVESKSVGEDDRRAVLQQHLAPVPVHRMDRHHEHSKLHSSLRSKVRLLSALWSAARACTRTSDPGHYSTPLCR